MSCMTEEEKPTNAVEKYMSEHSDNPKSYEPISTIIIDTIYYYKLIEKYNNEISDLENDIKKLQKEEKNLIKDFNLFLTYEDKKINKIFLSNIDDVNKFYNSLQNQIIKLYPKQDSDELLKSKNEGHLIFWTKTLTTEISDLNKSIEKLHLTILLQKCNYIQSTHSQIESNLNSIESKKILIKELNEDIYKNGKFSYDEIKILHQFRASNKFNAIVIDKIYFNYNKNGNVYKID